jgi:hypothetical protein
MKEGSLKRIYWILTILSVSAMAGYQIWNAQRPSEEEVQQRMQEGLRSLKVTEEVREMEARLEADRQRSAGSQGEKDR